MDSDEKELISNEVLDDTDKDFSDVDISAENNTEQSLSLDSFSILIPEGAGESSTDPEGSETNTSTNAESNHLPSQCTGAYRPIPDPSSAPPIPPGIPPPPYQSMHLGPIPVEQTRSVSDEPPPAYPGPPLTYNPPAQNNPQRSEDETRREIGRLIALNAIISACASRNNRQNSQGSSRPGGSNTPGRITIPIRRRVYYTNSKPKIFALIATFCFAFIAVGIIIYSSSSKSTSDDHHNDDNNYNYDSYYTQFTTKRPAGCSNMYCLNGGVCRSNYFYASCVCLSQYYGKHCEYHSTMRESQRLSTTASSPVTGIQWWKQLKTTPDSLRCYPPCSYGQECFGSGYYTFCL